jgi:integrase
MPRKKRPEGTRAPNGAGSIYYSETDGYWHGRIIVGIKDNGEPDRRHRRAKTEKALLDKINELKAEVASGKARKPGRTPTVGKWLTHWVEDIAPRTVRFSTLSGYRTAVYRYLIPNLSAHLLDRTEPEHFEKLYTKILKSGGSAYTANLVHRTARASFNEAIRRGVIVRNPVSLAHPPKIEEEEREPFEPDDVRRIIAAALRRRNGVRFVIALALGIRQGEALGIKRERLDPRKKALRFPKQLQRQSWQHGCEDPAVCAAPRHKAAPCPKPCTRHKRPESCRPCPASCTGHARHCPQRHGGGLVEVPVKSRAGRRYIVLPDRLWDLIEAHSAIQDQEREFAGTEWHDEGWMFAQENGRPIDPKADRAEWHDVLAEAGVREARLHDARHTAATVLALLEVAPRAAMDFMGWSNPDMMLRYQHVTDAMRRDIAKRLGAHLWDSNPSPDS